MTGLSADRAAIRTAHSTQARTLTGTVVTAYSDVPLYQWLAPSPRHRRGVLTGYFRILLTHALEHGHVEVIDGERAPLAVAGWLPSNAAATPPDFTQQVARVCGMWSVRFETLHAQLARAHPHGHRRLVFLAVAPSVQGQGLGGKLLAHHLDYLDERGISATVQAASPRSVSLFARQGFAPHGGPIEVATDPDCVLTPMRRSPRPPETLHND